MHVLRLSLPILTAAILAACSPQNASAPQNAASQPTSPASTPVAAGETKNLAITAITEHPALDDIRYGLLEQLKTEGFEEGKI